MGKPKERHNRNWKQRNNVPREINEKHLAEYKANVPPLKPMNHKQKEYIRYIREYDTVIATGYPGSSKTFIPTVMACDMLRAGTIEKIVLTRPNISSSKSLGFFSGDKDEKMSMWLLPVLSILNERLGQGAVEVAIKTGAIEFVPLEIIKGSSFKNAFIICDEAEDLEFSEFKKVITRVGENSKIVFAGDLMQVDLKKESGLAKALHLVKIYPDLNTAWVDFNHLSDIVRSNTVKNWIRIFNREGL